MAAGHARSQFTTLEPPTSTRNDAVTVSSDATIGVFVDAIIRQLKMTRMTTIKLAVSDVDGHLVDQRTRTLTHGASGRGCGGLHEAGIGFTIVSSGPTIGMGFLVGPLR